MAYRTRSRSLGIFSAGSFPQGVKWLLITNVGVFIFFFLAQSSALGAELFRYLELLPVAVVRFFMVWQLVTYMFLHGGFLHIIWNKLALWMFGAELERTWGTRRFLRFYFFCGAGAGVCVVVANYLFGDPSIPTIGSSGAIYGILLAYALLFPKRIILWGFLIPIQVRYFVIIVGAIAFLNSIGPQNTGISEFAHLGGLLFGYLFLKGPRLRLSPVEPLRRQYQLWKLHRSKRKFQVYLRKQDSDRDPWVH
jgi:membrane associated rhomboid family serine protease